MSVVQRACLNVLLDLEDQERAIDNIEKFKLALITSDPDKWTPVFFPTAPNLSPDPVSIETEDLLDTSGEWRFEEDVDPEEAAQTLQELLANPVGVVRPTGPNPWV